ncbi:hypothetical protein GGR57DRAFT_477895 [Xylariaceae sp. FL1272]|nr:hypothetical protein GGR57DRAFT_477895 [Xylariaceae sp. FL1272]
MPATRPPCLICKAVEGKYKCPRCESYTCSVACSREHRDNHPAVEEEPTPIPTPNPAAPQPTAIDLTSSEPEPSMRMSDIVDTPEYARLLQQYPVLETALWDIAKATDPPKPGQQQPGKNAVWTKEVGMNKAVNLVQRYKTSSGDVRDAVREFSLLVGLYKQRIQKSEEEKREREREKAEDDVKALRKLISEEKS